ncbi:putative iron-regulated membrane protein [Azonexus fungiphilus]|uniref:Putative iron-regulated membrane protein n=1 Tax=Azonexus fungiphilus TaxID=146940 RepID=A0A495VK11_9RHOO|nr:PepSY-associated TM helix domain-containing protein [Azonexus fungiphilus]RKT49634.1 putative iron-regulated membrane protein [Azonexus fungiphilus]
MRPLLVRLHRWFGLFCALFLIISGLTGSIIAWNHELEEWLAPDIFTVNPPAGAKMLAPLSLARQLEAEMPGLQLTYLPLSVEPGHSLGIGVAPRPAADGSPAIAPGFNQMAVDPYTGRILGQRQWGEFGLAPEKFFAFLYKLHYSLHLPAIAGIPVGTLLMGIVGMVWTIDAFVALWISFPAGGNWRKSFAFRWRAGGYRLNFDLHRSGGVWVWALLLILAFTSVSMNLGAQVVRPLVGLFSPLTPLPAAGRTPAPADQPHAPALAREPIIELARQEAGRRGWQLPAGAIAYNPWLNLYGVAFFDEGDDHGGKLGPPWLYFDGNSGALAGEKHPGHGSAGDIFMHVQHPLHSGRILGLPGRIAVSLLGLVIAMLSLTGVYLWWKKRRAREQRR